MTVALLTNEKIFMTVFLLTTKVNTNFRHSFFVYSDPLAVLLAVNVQTLLSLCAC